MPLEITAVLLSVIMLGAVVVTMVIALTGVTDPPAFTHCRTCARWTIDTRHRPDPTCVRCRLSHRHDHRLPFVPTAHRVVTAPAGHAWLAGTDVTPTIGATSSTDVRSGR